MVTYLDFSAQRSDGCCTLDIGDSKFYYGERPNELFTLSRHAGLAVLAVAAIFAFGVAPTVAAEDCYRGTLDKRYCDRNRDQVADLPLDPKDWVNPSTIIFSYTPVEDFRVYAKVWKGFVDHVAKCGRKQIFPKCSLCGTYETMRSQPTARGWREYGWQPRCRKLRWLGPFP